MGTDTFSIKYQEHFKLWVELKDKIVFESELIKKDIPFHIDENQSTIGSSIRYFLLDEHFSTVDLILRNCGIAASTDNIKVYDVDIEKKIQRIYWIVAIVIAVIFLLIMPFVI
ncbi:MAG TPA: hypothetical protein VEA37_11805 [Flavobacterium sp.]|nr:hypothetical protein [Flavobacterium sp.]